MPSVWQNIGNAVKKGVGDTGHAVGTALNNPVVKGLGMGALALSGVGLPAAIGIGGGLGALGGAIRPGGGLKGAITQGAQGAALGAGGSLAGSAGRAALGVLGDHGAAAAGGLPGVIQKGASAIPGMIGGLAKDALGGGGLGSTLLGGAELLNAANLGRESSEYADKAFNLQNDSYQQRAPLRALGMQRLTNPAAPNVSGMQATTAANPFAPRTPALGVR